MRLSRSKWENFIRCPFCFYLKEKHNIDPPRTPGHPINSRVDSLLKTEFDELRKNQQPHPIFKKYNLNFVPYKLDQEKLDAYRSIKKGVEAKSTKTKLLVSWHDFKKTPKSSELKNKIKQMSKFSSNVKIVSTAKSTYDSTRMLELYNSKGKNNLISFAMGDVGKISRILCLYLGSPYTYVSLGKAVAPGQFSIDEVKKIINLKRSK